MEVSDIQLFQILKDKVGEQGAKTITEFIETKVEKHFDIKKDVLATKQDISDLKIEISNVRNELKLEIADSRTELRSEIANSKSDIIKWMFFFWIGQVASVIAIVEFLIKK